MGTTAPLSDDCRAELSGIMGVRDSSLVADLFDILLAYVDHNPSVLPYSTNATARAARALSDCLVCIEEHPQIENTLRTLKRWQAWRASAAVVLERLNEMPIEITRAESADGGRSWRPLGKQKTAKEGRPREEHRDALGIIVATAFRFAGLRPTRGRLGDFAKAYRSICKDLGVYLPKDRHPASLDACIRRSSRLYADLRLSEINAAADAQMDLAMKDVALKLPRKTGVRKVRT